MFWLRAENSPQRLTHRHTDNIGFGDLHGMTLNDLPQTNFNTVLTREKLKKEQIISELTEKLRNVTQQQDKDKGESRL